MANNLENLLSPSSSTERFSRGGIACLLDAAVDLIADKGLETLTLRGLAKAAGCSLGTVSYHFTNKDDLLAGVFSERVLPRLRPHIKPVFTMDPAEGLQDIIKNQLPFTLETERLWRVRINYLNFAANNPKYRNQLQCAQQQSELYFAEQFERLKKAGRIHSEQTAHQLSVDFLLLLEGAGLNMIQVTMIARSFYAARVMDWLTRLLRVRETREIKET